MKVSVIIPIYKVEFILWTTARPTGVCRCSMRCWSTIRQEKKTYALFITTRIADCLPLIDRLKILYRYFRYKQNKHHDGKR